jgi:hypothetical protein
MSLLTLLYREHAEQLRILAETSSVPSVIKQMAALAVLYDSLADQAERNADAPPKPPAPSLAFDRQRALDRPRHRR